MTPKQYSNFYRQYLGSLPSGQKSAVTARDYKAVLQDAERFFAAYEQITGDSGDIKPLTVVSWRNGLHSRGLKHNTVRYYMTVLRAFFGWAVRMGIEHTNPIPAEEVPEQKPRDYDLLDLAEIHKLLVEKPSKMRVKNTCRNRAIVVLLIMTGLRNSELRGLTPADLDFDGATITVRAETAKGEKARTAAFPAPARQAVLEYLNSGERPNSASDNDCLFGTTADENGHDGAEWHKFTSCGLTTMVKRYVEKVTGHKNIGAHDLRHAYASMCDNLGVPLRQIQLSMGHSSEQITEKVYITCLDKNKAATTVNAAFDVV